ncbi:hypothetical protein H5399_05085 [Tessaracoccus sp. MC1627]|uniref:hypothetical protein n=1 Tax=Tessaracoccus sp. MC1627 TaxID=2760312 RepID=UPI0015FF85B2|nr:hypothetical protein [Tessaracoccus sp. MC1627]MBB1511978.1 hypothetical protein [Tessaracoccus sp. MC1627]
MPARFRVVAAVAVARVPGPRREVYIYRGSLLPAEVEAAESARLVKRGLVVEVPVELPVIQDGAEFVEGAAGVDPDAPTVEAEPVKPVKPQAPKPAAK